MALASLAWVRLIGYVTCNGLEGVGVDVVNKPKPGRERVREHRERLRSQGMRQIQIWVPDVRSAAFSQEAHRQSLAVATSVQEGEDQAFIDAVSELFTE